MKNFNLMWIALASAAAAIVAAVATESLNGTAQHMTVTAMALAAALLVKGLTGKPSP